MNSQKAWYSKIKNNVKGGREYEVKKRYHKYCSDISCYCRGLSVNQEKVQASDADLGFEPYVTDYATPAKQETSGRQMEFMNMR